MFTHKLITTNIYEYMAGFVRVEDNSFKKDQFFRTNLFVDFPYYISRTLFFYYDILSIGVTWDVNNLFIYIPILNFFGFWKVLRVAYRYGSKKSDIVFTIVYFFVGVLVYYVLS
jgi:hypothetical protein